MESTPLSSALKGVNTGDHLCCLYESEEEHRTVITPFLRRGLERGEKVLYLADTHTVETIEGYFKKDGTEVGPFIERGQLIVLGPEDWPLREGFFDPDRTLAWLRTQEEQARMEGFGSLRITSEMTRALRRSTGCEQLPEYEAKINSFLPGSNCLAVCQYDRGRFESGLLLDVLKNHPVLVFQAEAFVNFHYMPSGDLPGPDHDAKRLSHYLDTVVDRKRVGEALGESKQRLADMIDFLPDATFAIDLEGKIIAWNKAIEEMTGFRAKDMIGKGNHEYALPFYGKRRPILVDLALRSDQETEKEYVHIRKAKNGLFAETDRPFVKGRDLYLWAKAGPVLDRTGQTVGAVESIRDITERKRMEEERERLLRDLQTKTKELEQIVYVSSHDLRSPLVNIQGFAGEIDESLKAMRALMREENSLPDLKTKLGPVIREDIPEALRFILAGTSKMDGLISGLLRLSRLGRAALVIKKLRMSRLVTDVVESLEYVIMEKGARVELEELPPCMGDKMQINQVFSNLLDNALKFLDPDRPGRIRVWGREEAGRAVYCVADNGVGIAAEDQEKIFEIFHRLDPGCAPGEGLGLTIVRRILDREEGMLWVESEPGKGSRFFLSLPAARPGRMEREKP